MLNENNIKVGDECYCIKCNIMRKVQKVEYIPPEFAECQTIEYRIITSCGHQLSIKISNYFDD